MLLANQVAVITGAASGIGQALALALAECGCHLALIDCNEKGLQYTRQRLDPFDITVSCHVADLADKEAVRALPDTILQQHGSVNLLINNAGVAIGGRFSQVRQHDFDWLMNINFYAVVALCRGFLPHMEKQSAPAKIVNMSSLYGLIAPPHQSAYSASKFAVRGFSQALQHELTGSHVSVLVVHPGGVATNIANNAIPPPGVSEEEVQRQKKQMNRLLRLSPDRAARIIVKAIQKDKRRVLVGLDARIVALIERIMPVSYWRIIEKLTQRRNTP